MGHCSGNSPLCILIWSIISHISKDLNLLMNGALTFRFFRIWPRTNQANLYWPWIILSMGLYSHSSRPYTTPSVLSSLRPMYSSTLQNVDTWLIRTPSLLTPLNMSLLNRVRVISFTMHKSRISALIPLIGFSFKWIGPSVPHTSILQTLLKHLTPPQIHLYSRYQRQNNRRFQLTNSSML
jgi:hypothetical protein